MNTRRIALAATTALALTLAACSGSQPEAPNDVEENATVEEVINEEPPVVNEAPVEAPLTNITPPAPTVRDDRTADAQMYDDADAVGMTARVDRGAGGENAAAADDAQVK
ncbi:hypothetical protein [Sphingomonas sp.]|uniref:hypothetical protein n=1 Tax=Sphingomonas sp. TaxID=28214 RepID=UPI002B87C53E|nr:hypothetical protein [Sphingomonas sp.]HWK35876.1 hypothetical protein [Sphingomonas sp.]